MFYFVDQDFQVQARFSWELFDAASFTPNLRVDRTRRFVWRLPNDVAH